MLRCPAVTSSWPQGSFIGALAPVKRAPPPPLQLRVKPTCRDVRQLPVVGLRAVSSGHCASKKGTTPSSSECSRRVVLSGSYIHFGYCLISDYVDLSLSMPYLWLRFSFSLFSMPLPVKTLVCVAVAFFRITRMLAVVFQRW